MFWQLLNKRHIHIVFGLNFGGRRLNSTKETNVKYTNTYQGRMCYEKIKAEYRRERVRKVRGGPSVTMTFE
jgi:hypothetical protein